ncbi:MAG: PepSY-like domain-containing protein [Bacteroidales bacterium]|nr:PepSY-like domain-containing protein [Bacteroidales bacterium]
MMKTVKSFLTILMALTISSVCLADDHPIPADQLPVAAKSFIQKYFPDSAISYALVGYGIMRTDYEARLADGTQVEFDRKGNWTGVDANHRALPAGIVPERVAAYIQAKFPDTGIIKITRKWFGFETELMNGVELRFNADGAFIGYDR